ncbi:calcium-binding protein [Streptomyces sp. NEAU-W12]|uniref:calcium-binding protein n=1 Tax=Streptomyces sp. NEAU-W12 TaxID=2994668 RepID=UPI00224B7CA1|nr:calcium-binding protein [Streptomyces sp. NEAU-W12]MCX2925673.1 calcium-binding protein [Streptomyces sp. NEAU-W12]
MRIRATVAAVSGALALSALAVPAAQADGPGDGNPTKTSAAERFGTSSAKSSAKSTARVAAAAAPTVSSVKVNGGKNIVLGTTTVKTFSVSLTASHPSGIADAYVDLWHGTDVEAGLDGYLPPNEDVATCTATSATTSNCKLTITAEPGYEGNVYANFLAGTWKVSAGVLANDGEMFWDDYYKTHKVQRLSKLTVNASPEPVTKGKTLTVTGKLSRANWETGSYSGLPSGQSVALQFRKSGTSTYTNVKGIKTAAGGALKTTVTAATDGYHRFKYAGITSTAPATAAGDFVDVK